MKRTKKEVPESKVLHVNTDGVVSSMLLVKLSVHSWGGKTQRKDLAKEVADSKSAREERFDVLMGLLPKVTRRMLESSINKLRWEFNYRTAGSQEPT